MTFFIWDAGWLMADATGSGMDPASVGTMIGVIITALIGGGYVGRRSATVRLGSPVPDVPVRVESGHVEISMRDKFLTRAEFLEYKGEIKTDIVRMISLYDKALTLINERDSRLGEKLEAVSLQLHLRITEVVNDASERRRKIYDKQEEQGEALARIDARTDVSKAIGQLGKAIIANSKNS